ncbi:hypothetical protein LEF84_19390 [Salmonella enterica]|uniref:hypothetical protein n=1 Tax=Salmonella sp. JS051105201500009SM TaxID=2819704 RepID=UPI001AAFF314|nr:MULTISPECIES: hypothetical protein [Salmonella]MBO2336103.1 hypothetical protein [Salmonella sp. JS051105201500009SM]MDJ7413370.1 hypothetical protein [Salmonella enterica]MDJ8125768.1 hypothetical protein [Salmonella enterica]WRP12688.1 hypothetical protein U9J36_09510 [Salmonella enterica]
MADAFILLGIVMAMVSLGFILINKLFCFISAGCLLSLCASMASFQLWDASYWGRWGKVCPGLDVIISCDNYHFLYDLGWELYGIAFLFFTALMLTCAAIILINMIMALERYCSGWRR